MSATIGPSVTKDRDVTVRLRPTLFVGLGGTGKEVLLRLRRRILQNDWGGRRIDDLSRFPIASFLYFDTDTTEAIESDRSKGLDPLARLVSFRESERLQKRVDVRHYMNEIENFPHIQSWLPEADLSSINTEKGAGQVRAISRLLFFDQFKILQGLLRAQGDALLNSVGRQNELTHLNLDIEHELRVVVVCSAAGGTGSGSFIDFGLAIRSMRNPRPAQTDLVLLLPGGFKGANYERVNANAFASLMELEHAMRPNTQPPYADRWADLERPLPNLAPYNDVYLTDSRNVLGAGTGKIDEIYDMIADVLFEDFGSSEFAGRKRSIAPNQAQFKVVNYLPPLSQKVGEKSLSYSCGYSSFGQATIDTKARVAVDTAVAQCAQGMLKSYFNVAMEDSGRLPTTEERDRFLAEQFQSQQTSFEDALEGLEDRDSINEPTLIETLLQLESGESVVANVGAQVHRVYESDRFRGDLRNLPTLVLREFDQRRSDVLGTIEHRTEAGPAAMHVSASRRRLAARLRGGGDEGLRATLFRYLDNRARGGLDYTIHLVQDSKLKIDELIAELERIEQRYLARADQTRRRFEHSLENLKEAVGRGFPFGPDRKAADRYLEHLRTETVYHLAMLLRRQAALEARIFLREMSDELGTPRGVDNEGRTIWDGAIATLVAGRTAVERTLHGFDTEISLLRDAVSREDAGMFLVLPDADADAETLLRSSQADIDRWAQDIFQDEGGSRTLFPVLEDDGRRAVLLGKLRGFAMTQLKPRADKLRSIHDILLGMSPRDRMAVFEKAMVRAMPWLNATFDHLGETMPMADRYKLLVAVESKPRFTADFERELKQVIPTGRLGLQNYEIVNSGLRNRIIIYCELSGIPLDSIAPLRSDWRTCYQSELPKAFPLHNHKQTSRFPNPVVPSGAEIEEMRRTMALFLRAACFGIIRRGEGPEAPYRMQLRMGDSVDIGTERDLRSGGFASPTRRRDLTERVERFERGLSPVQVLAAAALLEWTGERAYAARMVKVGPNQTDRIPGLVHRVALETAAGYRARLRAIPDAGIDAPDQARDALLGNLDAWTEEIANSVEDTDPMDASRDPGESEAVRAVSKRRILEPQFATGLERLIGRPMSRGAPPRQPVAASTQWHVSVNRQVSGPFTLAQMTERSLQGALKEATNVLPVGGDTWMKVRDVPVLLALTRMPPPPPDEDALPEPPDD
jgi:hypothetical protein